MTLCLNCGGEVETGFYRVCRACHATGVTIHDFLSGRLTPKKKADGGKNEA
jgi:hypothetical protein